jgi:hypothetical protein
MLFDFIIIGEADWAESDPTDTNNGDAGDADDDEDEDDTGGEESEEDEDDEERTRLNGIVGKGAIGIAPTSGVKVATNRCRKRSSRSFSSARKTFLLSAVTLTSTEVFSTSMLRKTTGCCLLLNW